jgi:hypothetical protein
MRKDAFHSHLLKTRTLMDALLILHGYVVGKQTEYSTAN